MEVGLRVVRGPDWNYGDQDGGEGHVGTVVKVDGASSAGCVDVLWDSGTKKTYRVGHESAFDLLVYDNSQCGVRHRGINCDVCQTEVIVGLRWKCNDCINFDLCTQCYMTDKHDVTHTYQRFYSPRSDG
ncbi:E3 ubiquitin-protein ligase MIB2-like [Physella acuta]|uniref:E3 ubiquitin-protein ligase MIB2-like n=1 Tax=Physella acuta TaxID=109671 RepID=UPI0027DAC25B|nr:E3 ubiquitin-protein ligase MIB2-like [Physella acuta]